MLTGGTAGGVEEDDEEPALLIALCPKYAATVAVVKSAGR
jgi:hypothetical protein